MVQCNPLQQSVVAACCAALRFLARWNVMETDFLLETVVKSATAADAVGLSTQLLR